MGVIAIVIRHDSKHERREPFRIHSIDIHTRVQDRAGIFDIVTMVDSLYQVIEGILWHWAIHFPNIDSRNTEETNADQYAGEILLSFPVWGSTLKCQSYQPSI